MYCVGNNKYLFINAFKIIFIKDDIVIENLLMKTLKWLTDGD